MHITVLGSRDQLCIHPDVKSLETSSDKIAVCREKVHRKTCVFQRNFESKSFRSKRKTKTETIEFLVSKPEVLKLPAMDIEDLVKEGIQKK